MSLENYLWNHSLDTQAISLNPDAALQRAVVADGFVPVSSEVWVTWGDERYAYMTGESLVEAGLRRVYYARVPEWNVVYVINDVQTDDIDMAAYFLPDDGDFSPIFVLANNWDGGEERVQLQRDGVISYVVKNRQYEKRQIGSEYIDMLIDTSPGDNQFYVVEGHWLPRYWRVGGVFDRHERVTFRNKNTCVETASFSWSSTMRLENRFLAWESPSGLLVEDVVEVVWILGGNIIERYWYAAGLGLVQWRANDGRESSIISFVTGDNNEREQICYV